MKIFLKITVLFFMLLTGLQLLNAQEFKIGLQSGIGNYKMSDLRGLNRNILKNTTMIGAKLISNYPQYYYYQPSVVFSYKRFNIGALYSQQSTGSRISVKDYSGEYRFDSKIKGTSFGVIGGVSLNPDNKLKFVLYNEFGFCKTKLNLVEFLKVNDETLTDDNFYFDSKNYYFEPGIKVSYAINFICFELNIGYFKQFGKEIFKGENDTRIIVNGNEIKPDWSGLRYGLSAYIVFPFKTKVKSDI